MGLFGGDSDVKAEQVNVDPAIVEALKKNTDAAANTSADDYSKRSMQGIGGPSDNSAQVAQSEKALGGDEPGISGAINQRYQGIVGEKLAALGNTAKLKGYETAANRQASAMQMQTAHNNILAENRRRQKEANDANENARGAALTSILRVAGTVVGAIFGGPAGAAIGGAAGTAVGGLASGSK